MMITVSGHEPIRLDNGESLSLYTKGGQWDFESTGVDLTIIPPLSEMFIELGYLSHSTPRTIMEYTNDTPMDIPARKYSRSMEDVGNFIEQERVEAEKRIQAEEERYCRLVLNFIREEILPIFVFQRNNSTVWYFFEVILKRELAEFGLDFWDNGTYPQDKLKVVCDETVNPPWTVNKGEMHAAVDLPLSGPDRMKHFDVYIYCTGITPILGADRDE